MMSYCGRRWYHLSRGKDRPQAKRPAMKWFPGLDNTFNSVDTMLEGTRALEVYCVFDKGLFQVFGALVIKDMKLGCIPIGLELGVC